MAIPKYSWPLAATLIISLVLNQSVMGKASAGGKETGHIPEEDLTDNVEKLTKTAHPLDPLTATEIRLAALIVRAYDRNLKLNFDCIELKEPPKSLLLSSFLTGVDPPSGSIERKASALVVERSNQTPYMVAVNLNTQKVESFDEANPDQRSPYITADDDDVVDKLVFSHPEILKRYKDLGFEPRQIVLDIWESGYVLDNPNYSQVRKLLQVFSYAINRNGENKFAHPLDFVVYVDVGAQVVRGIEDLPIHEGFDTTDRTGNSVPLGPSTLYPPYSFFRPDVAPIAISRPKGVSFQVSGRQVSWQNFKFRVGFSPLEAATIHHVSYNDNGNVRPLFYRISLSEIHYFHGDPRPPYHRKSSHEIGSFVFGKSGVVLSKEHCRGQAHFFDAAVHNDRAETSIAKNAICVFEEPAGILWSYRDTDYDRTSVKQSQRLVVATMLGIGNANYLISWRFYQDATVELAVRITGLLSTNLMAVDVKSTPYGNLLAPQIYTQNFQYIIGARVDADIDGVQNTVTMEDIERVSNRIDPLTNPYGNGIVVKPTVLRTAGEGVTDNALGRSWRISNPNQINPVNGKPTSYKLVPRYLDVPNLLTPDSPIRNRFSWGNHNMWVLPFNDDQIIINEIYLDRGVNMWVNENVTANIENTDVTLWPVFTFTHIPDVENWPIVTGFPTLGFQLKPSNFFTQSPAFNVPPASETTAYDDGGRPHGGGWRSYE